ncbi:hypothetical protein ABEB36_008376 [Hypothenemus hampei]|uniref:Uncharacterized protein n=1 Tax=Hypothenemus hampei TaxID=57062 RepID=A0ABD1ENU7_HYPHA
MPISIISKYLLCDPGGRPSRGAKNYLVGKKRRDKRKKREKKQGKKKVLDSVEESRGMPITNIGEKRIKKDTPPQKDSGENERQEEKRWRWKSLPQERGNSNSTKLANSHIEKVSEDLTENVHQPKVFYARDIPQLEE